MARIVQRHPWRAKIYHRTTPAQREAAVLSSAPTLRPAVAPRPALGQSASVRIQLLSDIHLEFHADGGRAFCDAVPVRGDVLVLAGDLCPLADLARHELALRRLTDRFAHVLWVPGNHEWYGARPDARLLDAVAERLPGMRRLDPAQPTVIDGVHFLGDTLWFPARPDDGHYRHLVADFQQIAGLVPWCHREHARAVAALAASIRPGDVVVTHHLPSPESVATRFLGSALNRFFMVDLTELILRTRPALWLHGHTHTSIDVEVGATRIACNPFGYLGYELNRGFREDFVVTVPRW